MIKYKSTQVTFSDIENCIEIFKKSEIELKACQKCGEEHLPNYGHTLGECDECWFSRFDKESVTKFYRSFFE